jgi:hypothetical protein
MATAAMPSTVNTTTRSVDPRSAPLTADDWAILDNVATAISQGQEIKEWWAANRDTRVRLNNFPVALQIHRNDENYGFVLDANLRSGALPVAGVIQDQLFSYPKAPPGSKADPQWIRTQLREFILRHFMTLTSAQPPSAPGILPCEGAGARAAAAERSRYGWGYEQIYYKLKKTGEIGKFPDKEATCIVPLDSVGTTYAWVVFKASIYHFDFPVALTGVANGPELTISMMQPVYAVMTPDFLVDREDPEPGVLGEYGYGYSVVPDPNYKTLFAAGPSQITHTIETLSFRVLDTGEIRSHMDFITPQPPRIVNFDPVKWGFEVADRFSLGAASRLLGPLKNLLEGLEPQVDPVYLAVRLSNLLTLGVASDDFNVNKAQLFRLLMTLHFTDVFNMFNLAASHFSMVDDWTDTANLPEWAKTGTYNPVPGNVRA